MKQRDIHTVMHSKTCSWMISKILKCQYHVDQIGGWETLLQNKNFSIKLMYAQLQGSNTHVPWKRVVCNNKAGPRSIFITWLLLHHRLLTADRLISWGVSCISTCPLCGDADETLEHLFFICPYSSSVWAAILQLLGIQQQLPSLQAMIEFAAYMCRKK